MAKEILCECKEREEVKLYGLWTRSSLSSAETEWEHLMSLYSAKTGDKGIRFVIRENTNEKKDCDLFCGGLTPGEGVSEVVVPAGTYVSTVVTPKFGLFWGSAMDDADIFLRNEWPEQNGCRLDDFRMEIRNMMGKKPSIEIIYRVLPRE